MSTARIYARNLAFNWISHAANMVVLFFLSPFVIHTLGNIEYGIWSLLSVLTGYMGIFDLGVRVSTGRHIALYLGLKDHEKVNQTLKTGLGIFTLVGILIMAGGIGLGWIFPRIFLSVPESYHLLVKILILIMAANIWSSALSAVFSSVLTSHDRFDIARGVDFTVLTARTIGTILALKQGYGVTGLAIVVLMSNMISLLSNWHLAHRIYPSLRAWPLALSRERVRELLNYGIAASISAICVKIIGQTDLVIVGALISIEAVTVYSVGAMLVFYSSTLIRLIGNTFFPSVQRAAARHEMDSVKWLFLRQVRLALMFGIPMFVGFMVFPKPFIRLWMLGPEFSEPSVEKAALVMSILAATKLFFLFTLGSGEILAAIGHVRFNAIIGITEAFVNLSLSLFFVMLLHWGLMGVALGSLVSHILVRTFIHPWYACQKVGLSWKKFLTKIGVPGTMSAVLFGSWCLLIQRMIPGYSWPLFFLQVAVALAGYVPIAMIVLIPSDDRRRIYRLVGIQTEKTG